MQKEEGRAQPHVYHSVAGPEHTPARPLFTSLPGGAVSHMLQVRTTAGGRLGERWAGRQES